MRGLTASLPLSAPDKTSRHEFSRLGWLGAYAREVASTLVAAGVDASCFRHNVRLSLPMLRASQPLSSSSSQWDDVRPRA